MGEAGDHVLEGGAESVVAFRGGETIAEGLGVVNQLNLRGINATLDHLGENTTKAEDARGAAEEVKNAADRDPAQRAAQQRLAEAQPDWAGLDEALCRRMLGDVLESARRLENFVRIDMEGSDLTRKRWRCTSGR